MGFWIFLMAVIAIVGIAGFIFLAAQDGINKGLALVLTGSISLGLMALVSGFFMAIQVPSGEVGVVRTFGKIDGQRPAGLQLIWPWQSIQNANTQLQSKCPGGETPKNNNCNSAYNAFSSETIDVTATVIVNYHVDDKDIQTLFRTIGPDYAAKLILPRVANDVKEQTVKYQAVDLAPSREKLRKDLVDQLRSELAQRSITVDDVLLINVDFPNQDVKKAIDGKVIQAQLAEAAKQQVEVAKQQALQASATAQGAADKTRIEAQGQADANNLINASLTPNLIQFQTVQKLAPNVSVMLLPSGSGNLLDVSSLIPAKK